MKPLPDPYPIEPLTKPPNCTITVPGSKSITNRALILAALSEGKCMLRGALWADDTQVMVDSLQKLGFEVTVEPDPTEECNRTITVVGRNGEIPVEKAELYVGNAGTAARFLTAFVSKADQGEYKIDGDARMRQRPMADLFEPLRLLGAEIVSPNDHLPATIKPKGWKQRDIRVSVANSTQFASALILAGLDKQYLTINELAEEYYYVSMTSRMVEEFEGDYEIEPDLSSASYFKAVEFLIGGRVDIAGWPQHSVQIDREFPRVLSQASRADSKLLQQATNQPFHRVSRFMQLGDSAMTLVVCAPYLPAGLRLMDATNMRQQETDRITALVTELRRVGAEAEEYQTELTVSPAKPGQLHGADIETYNDHRMAMCFSVLGLKVPGIRIKNPQCVTKTFPNFFEKLEQLRQ